jgi:glycosyltransferase 2 family protein
LRILKSRRFWGLLLTVGLLVYCFYDFDFHGIIKAIVAVHFWYLIPLIFLEAIIAYIRTARLKYIIDPVKSIKVNTLYPIYCIGMMTNLLMPYLTGQVARIYLLSKRGHLRKTFLVTTTVLEVLFDGLALIGITLVFSLFFVLPSNFHAWDLVILAGIMVLATALLFWMSRRKGRSSGIIGLLIKKLPKKLEKKVEGVRSSFLAGLETLRSSRHLLMVSLLSLLSWIAQAAMVYLLILAFGFDISIWGAVIITTVVTVMMIIVLSPVNIGTFQAATLAALGPFGIVKSPALAFSFLLHIAVYIPPIILGAFFSFKEGLTLKELKREGAKSEQESGDDGALDESSDQLLETR